MDRLFGLDISNVNDTGWYRSGALWQRAEFIIVQAIPRPRPDGVTSIQLDEARVDGKYRGAYTWLWHTPSWRLNADVATDQYLRLATIKDRDLDMRLWLDLEDEDSVTTVEQRRRDVTTALWALNNWSHDRGLPRPGIYSRRQWITDFLGGWLPEETPLWLADYSHEAGSIINPDLANPVVIHQYSGTSLDQNVMLASEINLPEEDSNMKIPAEYVQKFSLPDDSSQEALQGLIDNLEGVAREQYRQGAKDAVVAYQDLSNTLDVQLERNPAGTKVSDLE